MFALLLGPQAWAQTDTDGDGVDDAVDLCPGTAPGVEVDAAGCEILNTLDMPGWIDPPASEAVIKWGRFGWVFAGAWDQGPARGPGCVVVDFSLTALMDYFSFRPDFPPALQDGESLFAYVLRTWNSYWFDDQTTNPAYTDACRQLKLAHWDTDGDGIYDQLEDTDGDGVVDQLDLCPGTPPGTTVDADGCDPTAVPPPPPPTGWVVSRTDGGRVYPLDSSGDGRDNNTVLRIDPLGTPCGEWWANASPDGDRHWRWSTTAGAPGVVMCQAE